MQALTMHGYAFYVWSSYGFVSVGLVCHLFLIKRQKTRIHQQLHQWFKQ